MSQINTPDAFRNPAVHDTLLPWSPYLRLAHNFPITQNLPRLFLKEKLGDHALHYFHTGKGEYHISGKIYPIVPRCVILRRPGEGYHFVLAENTEIRMLNLHFDLNEIPASRCLYPCPYSDAELKDCLPPELPAYQRLNNYPAYEQIFFQLLDTAEREGITAHLQRKGLLLEIIALLYANMGTTLKSVTLHNHQNAIDKAVRYIQAHPETRLSLEELADIAGVSRALFCRVFRQTIGTTPQKYINRHRIQLASAELLYGKIPVKEIAERYGFANVHHFSRIFKSITGNTPAGFRSHHNLYE